MTIWRRNLLFFFVAQKSYLSLESLRIITNQVDKGKGHVYEFGLKDFNNSAQGNQGYHSTISSCLPLQSKLVKQEHELMYVNFSILKAQLTPATMIARYLQIFTLLKAQSCVKLDLILQLTLGRPNRVGSTLRWMSCGKKKLLRCFNAFSCIGLVWTRL